MAVVFMACTCTQRTPPPWIGAPHLAAEVDRGGGYRLPRLDRSAAEHARRDYRSWPWDLAPRTTDGIEQTSLPDA